MDPAFSFVATALLALIVGYCLWFCFVIGRCPRRFYFKKKSDGAGNKDVNGQSWFGQLNRLSRYVLTNDTTFIHTRTTILFFNLLFIYLGFVQLTTIYKS